MADNPTPIAGSAPARNHFPQTVGRLAVQASRAALIELCRQALADGMPHAEVMAFLESVNAECQALVDAVQAKGGGQ